MNERGKNDPAEGPCSRTWRRRLKKISTRPALGPIDSFFFMKYQVNFRLKRFHKKTCLKSIYLEYHIQ